MPEAAKLSVLGAAPAIQEDFQDSVGMEYNYQTAPIPHLAQADSPAPTAARQRDSDTVG